MFRKIIDFVEVFYFLSKKTQCLIIILLFFIISMIIGYFIKTIFIFLGKLLKRSNNSIINSFINKSNYYNFSFLISFFIYKSFINIIALFYKTLIDFNTITNIINVIIVIFFYLIIRKTISNINNFFKENHSAIALSSFFELLNIFLLLSCLILSISILFSVKTTTILGTLGALTAIVVLIFKDIILGFVTGMQIYYNKIFKIGDWIELYTYNADGEIIEINLVSTKILNWDRTITTIPTYALINAGIKNWNNISKISVRRIKSLIYIDLYSIRLLSHYEIQNIIKKYPLLKNITITPDITNLFLFRKYITLYLYENENISKDNTIIVRNLQSNNFGIPIEIYCFTNTAQWEIYEDINSKIIEYAIITTKEFDLKIFESPKGQ